MAAMGMMNDGYFVGRKELTNWIKGNFDAGFSKVEDLASGVIYCQIVDSIYPGVIQMSKVKRDAKIEVDFLHNFKILQKAFATKKIDRYIEVNKLVKRSFQYNMEFLQFMKCYWDMHVAPEMRGEPFKEVENVKDSPPAKPAAARKMAPSNADRVPPARLGQGAQQGGARQAQNSTRAAAPNSDGQASQQLQLEVTELKLSVDNLERERDFYYSKLREVEVLCQEHEGQDIPFLNEVLAILYKTDDGDEFVSPEECVEEPIQLA